MGHYLSEMSDGPNTPSPPRRRKGLDEKTRRVISGPADVLGSMDEDTVRVEYVADFDVYDYDARYLPKRSDDPENNEWKPQRTHLYSPEHANEEQQIEYGLQAIRMHGNQDRTGRPGLVMKRTVTYGPWEVIAESSEHTEGYY